jgi:hypothetical protein
MQRVTIAQFVHESDADGFAQALRRLEPEATFLVVFDPSTKQAQYGDR